MHSNRNASSVSILAFLYIEITSASQIMFESHIGGKNHFGSTHGDFDFAFSFISIILR